MSEDRINLYDYKAFFIQLGKNYKMGILGDDELNNFAEYFYRTYNYNPEYAPTTYIGMKFQGWRSLQIRAYHKEQKYDWRHIDKHGQNWWDAIFESEVVPEEMEKAAFAQEVVEAIQWYKRVRQLFNNLYPTVDVEETLKPKKKATPKPKVEDEPPFEEDMGYDEDMPI